MNCLASHGTSQIQIRNIAAELCFIVAMPIYLLFLSCRSTSRDNANAVNTLRVYDE